MNLDYVSTPVFRHIGVFCTFKIGHVCPNVRVQGIDDHFAISRACDLDAPIDETRGWWCALPRIVLTNMLGLWKEVEEVSLVELSLADYSSLQKRFPALVECAVEEGKEDTGVLAEDVPVLIIEVSENVDLAQNTVGVNCHGEVCMSLGSYLM